MPAQVIEESDRLGARSHLNADEDMGGTLVVVAVVELGDVARTDQRQELPVGARLLGQGNGENRLPLLADLGALGHEA